MTLVLAFANSAATVMLADRRLSIDGVPTDDESNKIGSLVCLNARVAFGYTGLATSRDGSFNTFKWLVETLLACGPNCLGTVLEFVTAQATAQFALLSVPPEKKRLTIVFAGYLYQDGSEPRGVMAFVTNFEDIEGTGAVSPVAKGEFELSVWTERRPVTEPYTLVAAHGAVAALRISSTNLRRLLAEHRPIEGIRDSGLSIVNRVAAARGQPGPIGRQCGSLIVPSDPSRRVTSNYHSGDNVWRVDYPAEVTLVGLPTDGAVMGLSLAAEGAADGVPAIPLAVTNVGRNHPCPCGSGKKYKLCHGRPPPARAR